MDVYVIAKMISEMMIDRGYTIEQARARAESIVATACDWVEEDLASISE